MSTEFREIYKGIATKCYPHTLDIAMKTMSWLNNMPSQIFWPSLLQSYPKALFSVKF